MTTAFEAAPDARWPGDPAPPQISRDVIARRTFVDFGRERLRALCAAVAPLERAATFRELFQRLTSGWGDRPIGVRPRCPSNIADDQAPFEFALAISGRAPEVQFYVEAQGDPPTLRSNMVAGRALLDAIAGARGLSLERLRRVEPLFFPEAPGAPFALWIGASWAPGREIKLKVYLNPQVRSPERAGALVADAFDRLGFSRAWSAVEDALRAREGCRHELGIVSLDLSDADDARVKIYLRHHHATVADIEAVARVARDHRPGDVVQFYAALAGTVGPFLGKPVITELSFVGPDAERPAAVTLEFPIGAYVDTDEEAARRIARTLIAFDLPADVYHRALRAFATRPLDRHAGIQAHVTLSRVNQGPRVGVYFASEAYGPGAAQSPARDARPPERREKR